MSEMDTNDQSPFDSIMEVDADSTERWSARKLQGLMGYARWDKFQTPLQRAMATARNQGSDVEVAFSQVTQLPRSGNLGEQEKQDYRLTRFAAYLVAMNGDPNKSEVASAQAYFATKTREAETRQPMTRKQLAQYWYEAEERAEALEAQNQQLSEELSEAAPKVSKWEAFMNTDGLIGMTELGQVLGVSAQKMTKMLVEKKIFYVLDRPEGKRRVPYKPYRDNGMFTVKAETHRGEPRTVVYATPSGADHVMDLSQNPLARID